MTTARLCRGAGFAVALAAGAAGACADAPTDPTADARSVRLALNDSAAAAFQMAVDDVRARVVPGLATDASRRVLAPLLDSLAAAVGSRDGLGLRAAVARAETALTSLEGTPGGSSASGREADDPELSVVRLVLDHARLLAAGGPVAR